MARLYADENFPIPVVAELRKLGHDVLTIQEDGKANQRYPDDLVLQDTTNYKRAVLTTNRKHFRQLHRTLQTHGGIISCTFDPDIAGQAQRIHQSISHLGSLEGQLILIYRPQQ